MEGEIQSSGPIALEAEDNGNRDVKKTAVEAMAMMLMITMERGPQMPPRRNEGIEVKDEEVVLERLKREVHHQVVRALLENAHVQLDEASLTLAAPK